MTTTQPSVNNKYGFTIVELLIVIVVIGILAAITIVAYNGVQNRANDTTVQSNLATTSKKMEIFLVENERYPNSIAELTSLKLMINSSSYDSIRNLNFSYCRNADFSGYAIGGISKSGKQYYISSANGVQEYSPSLANDGNREDIGISCADLLAGGTRLQAGYYKADTVNPWRPWTK